MMSRAQWNISNIYTNNYTSNILHTRQIIFVRRITEPVYPLSN